MIRKEIINMVNDTIENEYNYIVEKYGEKYNSLHEGYAVLLEEVEEAQNEFTILNDGMKFLWNTIKQYNEVKDKYIKKDVDYIKNYAQKSIYELAQVVAVCKRLENTVGV